MAADDPPPVDTNLLFAVGREDLRRISDDDSSRATLAARRRFISGTERLPLNLRQPLPAATAHLEVSEPQQVQPDRVSVAIADGGGEPASADN
jgi:hypothetical protein